MQYFYHKQFKKHIVSFMEIFRGMVVKTGISKDGTIKDIEVPIGYGSMDKVAASIAANNTQNLPIRLPILSANLSNISMATNRYKGIDTSSNTPYIPNGGAFPNDVRYLEQLSPITYNLSFDLNIFSSNLDQQFQILEQILVLFNPSIQIQTSDNIYDKARITNVTLTGISNGENYPLGTDRRTLLYTLNFEMIIYLTVPAAIRDNIIKNIQLKITALNDKSVESENIDVDWDIINIGIDDALK